MCLQLLSIISLFFPSCSNCFPFCVKLYCTLSIKVIWSPHWGFVPCETEHWKWYWNWKIYTNLSCFNFMLELSCMAPRSCKYCNSISVFVIINEFNCFLQCVFSNYYHDRCKYFFIIARHSRSSMINDGWTDPISIWIIRHLYISSI